MQIILLSSLVRGKRTHTRESLLVEYSRVGSRSRGKIPVHRLLWNQTNPDYGYVFKPLPALRIVGRLSDLLDPVLEGSGRNFRERVGD